MPLREFWDENPQLFFCYVDAANEKTRADYNTLDLNAWAIGWYVKEAVAHCLSKDSHYPKRPMSEQNNKSEEEKMLDIYNTFKCISASRKGQGTIKLKGR